MPIEPKMQQVAVIIPIYKENPSESEQFSIIRAQEILGNYPIIFVCPKSLILDKYLAIIPGAKFEYFDEIYFSNVGQYSKLMLSSMFYKRFMAYEFILIYQTDALVFRDELKQWCQRNFDYIGAPWVEIPPLTNKKPIIDIQRYFLHRVGNGGLSLRKVKSHYRNTRLFSFLLQNFIKNEDIFWGLLIDFLNPFFKKPSFKEALSFAFELNPQKSFKLNNNKLPFGVHAWEKYDKQFWEKFI